MKASVLVVDDDADLRRALEGRFRFWGHHVQTVGDGAAAIEAARRTRFDLVLLDLNMPGLEGMSVLETLRPESADTDIVVLTAHGSVENAVEAMRRGADDFLTKPADLELLRRVVERALERRRSQRAERAGAERRRGPVLGPSSAMQEIMRTIERVAASDSTVLLCGESGTGKQVLAEWIHANSPRARGPFVYVNCVAISDELIESTLFGHERGAFTGAHQRKEGRLEGAAGGTAFLDEIGDISANLQAKLLHFLETGEFERVGGGQTLRVDCRIVAATNRDLAKDAEGGRFRRDLYYRLNVISVTIPPLRDRPEDIPVLAQAFVDRYAAEMKRPGLEIAGPTLDVLRAFPWPGNVRQLKNAVERMVVLAPGKVLTANLLPPEVLGPGEGGDVVADGKPWTDALREAKRRILRAALARHGGNQTKAAAELGLQRSYLNRLLKDLDLG